MNTSTHLLIGAAALARRDPDGSQRWRNRAIVVGALLPDAAIFVLFGWARGIAGISEHELVVQCVLE